MTALKVKFMYFDDCPSHEDALNRLKKILAEESAEAELEIFQVETDEDAQRLSFPGSPTIFINGVDIDPNAASLQSALSCRAYRRKDGKISPLPPEAMIRTAIKAGLKHA
jgi:hypothetical protein